mgnify:CR=1 FL=1
METNSRGFVPTEAKSFVEDEEEKLAAKDSLDVFSPNLGDKALASTQLVSGESGTTSGVSDCKDKKTNRYEKKNIYYKAIFRDIRKYFVEKLNSSTEYLKLKKDNKYKAFEPSITNLINQLLRTENVGKSKEDVSRMAQILGPYLNYNEYMVSFTEK